MKAAVVFLLPIFFLLLKIHGLTNDVKKDKEIPKHHLEETLDMADLVGGSRGRYERDVTTESEEQEYEEENSKKQKIKKPDVKNTEYKVTTPAQIANGDLKIPDDYNVYEIPKDPVGSAMPLFINLNIKKILDFDELDEIIKLDVELKVMWTDFKILYFNNKSLSPNDTVQHIPTIDDFSPEEIRWKRKVLNNPYILEKIWKPNLFIENLLAVRQPAIMARPLTIKFIPEVGWFEYITRISVKLDCGMDFNYYPADTQSCQFSIRGFSYVKKDLNLNWYKHGVYLDDTTLPSFDVKVDDLKRTDWNKKNEPDEIFDLLSFKILARRKLSYHLVQTYLASTFYIIITCLCFLLPSKMVEARIGISMTTLLTLTAMFASVRESTPIASYVKAIDVWMVGCIFFVFLTLSQFTFHIWLRNAKDEYLEEQKRKHDLKYPQETNYRSNTFEIDETTSIARRKSENPSQKLMNKFRRYEIIAEHLDTFSFPLFMCIFAVYTMVYWTWLMNSSGYYNWRVNTTWNNVESED